MTDTPETDLAVRGSNGQWSFGLRDLCERLERQRDAAVALNYAKAEIIDELADILNMPTGATDEEIGEAASEAIRQRDAYAETLRTIASANERSHHEAAFATLIRERHPELGNDKNPATGSTSDSHAQS